MDQDISCPSCHQLDGVQSVSAVRSAGVSTSSDTTFYTGIGITSDGLVPAFGTAMSERTQATELVDQTTYAPPLVPTAGPVVLGIVLAIPVLALLYPSIDNAITHPGVQDTPIALAVNAVVSVAFIALAAIPAIGAFAVVFSRVRRNSRITRGRATAYALWRTGFYCHRCGCCYWPYCRSLISSARRAASVRRQRGDRSSKISR